jgi:hypothetical protein
MGYLGGGMNATVGSPCPDTDHGSVGIKGAKGGLEGFLNTDAISLALPTAKR